MAAHSGQAGKAKGRGSVSHKPVEDLQESFNDDTLQAKPVRGRKRLPLDDEDDADLTKGGDMMTMLDRFGADISKAFLAKRKRLETFTKSSVKTSQQKIEHLWKTQQTDRSKVADDYSCQFNAVLQQWDTDMTKSKDQEEKQLSMFLQQQKMFQQMRASQSQRLKTLKQLLEQYIQSLAAMEKTHVSQQEILQSELRQEMAMFQKKLLMDTQQQEMASVRKSLQSMLM
ncbi:synaptonemal complex protein 3-like [Centroberyx affinis]|uniref:synaptonemal complex protein 3-like n=1 Tax=Centroberyx affinis TaxID=166261 RepID=UPI003A5C40E4